MSTIMQTGANVATDALALLGEIAFRDPAVGKIAGGAIVTAGGGYCLIKSGLLNILFQAETAPRLTVSRAVCATGGMSLMALGLYSICQGVSELWYRSIGCKPEEYANAQYFPNALKTDCAFLDALVQKIKSCPRSKELLDEAGCLTIEIDNSAKEALWDTGSRTLTFARSEVNSTQQFPTVVEMLCKARYGTTKAINLYRETLRGCVSFGQYLMRTAEHQFASRSCQEGILDDCSATSQNWSNSTAECPTFLDKWQESLHCIAENPIVTTLYKQWSYLHANSRYRRR